MRDAAHDNLAVELDHEPQHAVSRGMLQHVLAARLGFEPPRDVAFPRVTRRQWDADRAPLGVQPGRRGLELNRALAHSENGILPRSPWRSRCFMSSGSSANASAMDSSSIE